MKVFGLWLTLLLLFCTVSFAHAGINKDNIGLVFAVGGYSSIYQTSPGQGRDYVTTYNNVYSSRVDLGYFLTTMHQIGFMLNGDLDYSFSNEANVKNPTAYPTINTDLGLTYHLHTGGVYNRGDFFFGPTAGGSLYFTGEENIVKDRRIDYTTTQYGGFVGIDIGVNIFLNKQDAIMILTNPKYKFQATQMYLTDEGWERQSVNKFDNRIFVGLMTLFE